MIISKKRLIVTLLILIQIHLYGQKLPKSFSVKYTKIQKLENGNILTEVDSINYIQSENKTQYESNHSYHNQQIEDLGASNILEESTSKYLYNRKVDFILINSICSDFDFGKYERWNSIDENHMEFIYVLKDFSLHDFHSEIRFFQSYCDFEKQFDDRLKEIDCNCEEEQVLNNLVKSSLNNKTENLEYEKIVLQVKYEEYDIIITQLNPSRSNFSWDIISTKDNLKYYVLNPLINSGIINLMNPKFPIRYEMKLYREPHFLLLNYIADYK